MDNAMKDSDPGAYNALRRWGVRYVVGENMAHHGGAGARELYLDNQLKRVYTRGRFEVLEVLGYGFPPT